MKNVVLALIGALILSPALACEGKDEVQQFEDVLKHSDPAEAYLTMLDRSEATMTNWSQFNKSERVYAIKWTKIYLKHLKDNQELYLTYSNRVEKIQEWLINK